MEMGLVPVRWRVLSGSWLKVMAMAAMLIDHTAGQILGHYEAFREPLFMVGRHAVNWYFLLRCVGRLLPAYALDSGPGVHPHRDVQRAARLHPWSIREISLLRLLSPAPAGAVCDKAVAGYVI